MNFIDKVDVVVQAGNGGNGGLSFRRERYISHGGPDGGDGGNGGDIVVRASRNENTLANFRHSIKITATAGQAGGRRRKHGKSAQPKEIQVPIGTIITDDQGKFIADLTEDNQTAVIAKGGRGGFGNAHFVSSIRQSPKFAEVGEKTEELNLIFELKMLADVGLVGLPNAGKSTLLATISNAKPVVADYPFTTIIPQLGVVDINRSDSILVADIPGLIEGANLGKGLGHQFLRHIERTQVLVHLIDVYDEDVAKDYEVVQLELKNYQAHLLKRSQLVLLNKIDGFDDKIAQQKITQLKSVIKKGTKVLAISAKSGQGIKEFLNELQRLVVKARAHQVKLDQAKASELPVIKLEDDTVPQKIVKTKTGFRVTGTEIERFAARTDFSNLQSVQRLRDILRKRGINRELIKRRVKDGDIIEIGKFGSFEY